MNDTDAAVIPCAFASAAISRSCTERFDCFNNDDRGAFVGFLDECLQDLVMMLVNDKVANDKGAGIDGVHGEDL